MVKNAFIFFRDESISTLPEVNVSSLLILCLLEQLCQFIEKDATKAKRLKDGKIVIADKISWSAKLCAFLAVLVVQLQALELIDVVSSSEDFKDMRNEYKDSLFRLVTTAQRIVAQETRVIVPKWACNIHIIFRKNFAIFFTQISHWRRRPRFWFSLFSKVKIHLRVWNCRLHQQRWFRRSLQSEE